MKIEYAVFWLGTQRKIYGDDSFYVLGEFMKSFKTKDEAIEYCKELNPSYGTLLTILEIYTNEKS